MTARMLMPWILWPFCMPVAVASGIGRATPAAAEPVGSTHVLQVFLALGLILILIFAMAWLMRRMGGLSRASDGSLRILGGVAVGQRERVVLLQVGERQLLLGVAPGRVQTLLVLNEPLQATGSTRVEPSMNEGFAERLDEVLKKDGAS